VEVKDGLVTGRLTGEVSVRDTKARRVRDTLGGQPVDYAYGDSTSDVPLLEMAKEPVAVHPNDGLRQIASEKGWRIIGG
jgi:phosphoserine phosphatase